MIFRRPSDALQTPFQTIFERASHALLFLQTPFRRPSHTSPIPPYACALPLGRIAHAKTVAAPVSRTVANRLAQPVGGVGGIESLRPKGAWTARIPNFAFWQI